MSLALSNNFFIYLFLLKGLSSALNPFLCNSVFVISLSALSLPLQVQLCLYETGCAQLVLYSHVCQVAHGQI